MSQSTDGQRLGIVLVVAACALVVVAIIALAGALTAERVL